MRKATEARERNRQANAATEANWRRAGMFVCELEVHADGRHMGVRVVGREEVRIEGTWRTCTAVVARLFREAGEREAKRLEIGDRRKGRQQQREKGR